MSREAKFSDLNEQSYHISTYDRLIEVFLLSADYAEVKHAMPGNINHHFQIPTNNPLSS